MCSQHSRQLCLNLNDEVCYCIRLPYSPSHNEIHAHSLYRISESRGFYRRHEQYERVEIFQNKTRNKCGFYIVDSDCSSQSLSAAFGQTSA